MAEKMSYLGIDLGTSGLRALLVDDFGTPIASAERYYSVNTPHPGWSEQNPSDWIKALNSAIAELNEDHTEFSNLRGIGVAGHMHGAILLDKNGDVLRPCILWNDTRSETQAAALDKKIGIREVSGNVVFPGFTAPKLLWIREHEPEVFAKVAKVLLPAGYLNYYLTGEYIADFSDGAGTSWLDIEKRSWSEMLLEAGCLRIEQMPRLLEGSSVAGYVKREVLKEWAISGEVLVAGGAGDNAAAACGIGAVEDGDAFISLGTSGVILSARSEYSPAPETAVHTFCHAVPDLWYQMGVILAATDCLNWLSRIMEKSPHDLINALGEDVKPPSKVRFFPYLSGERTPYNDTQIRAAFSGLSKATCQEDITRAVLEGVAFGLKDSFEALKLTGKAPVRMMAIGGGSASLYWLKLIATCLDISLDLPVGREFGAALGSARLAIVASGSMGIGEIMVKPQVKETVEPSLTLRNIMAERFQSFREAYVHLKAIQ